MPASLIGGFCKTTFRRQSSMCTQKSAHWALVREQVVGGLLATVPFGAMGEPNDVAHLVLYLASDESRNVTGSEFMVDGGWHVARAG